jgi:hypothetical protein
MTDRICSVDDCDSAARYVGMCNRHYQRFRKYGDPTTPKRPSHPPAIVRFWAKVEVGPSDECWVWTGSRNSWGYGYFRSSLGVTTAAHRYSAQLHLPDYSDELWVLHHCDNPPCVNPAHLYMGTVQDNCRDMVERGRARNQYVGAVACSNGHPYIEGSYYVRRDRNERVCRVCRAERLAREKNDPEKRAMRLAYYREYRQRAATHVLCAPEAPDLPAA